MKTLISPDSEIWLPGIVASESGVKEKHQNSLFVSKELQIKGNSSYPVDPLQPNSRKVELYRSTYEFVSNTLRVLKLICTNDSYSALIMLNENLYSMTRSTDLNYTGSTAFDISGGFSLYHNVFELKQVETENGIIYENRIPEKFKAIRLDGSAYNDPDNPHNDNTAGAMSTDGEFSLFYTTWIISDYRKFIPLGFECVDFEITKNKFGNPRVFMLLNKKSGTNSLSYRVMWSDDLFTGTSETWQFKENSYNNDATYDAISAFGSVYYLRFGNSVLGFDSDQESTQVYSKSTVENAGYDPSSMCVLNDLYAHPEYTYDVRTSGIWFTREPSDQYDVGSSVLKYIPMTNYPYRVKPGLIGYDSSINYEHPLVTKDVPVNLISQTDGILACASTESQEITIIDNNIDGLFNSGIKYGSFTFDNAKCVNISTAGIIINDIAIQKDLPNYALNNEYPSIPQIKSSLAETVIYYVSKPVYDSELSNIDTSNDCIRCITIIDDNIFETVAFDITNVCKSGIIGSLTKIDTDDGILRCSFAGFSILNNNAFMFSGEGGGSTIQPFNVIADSGGFLAFNDDLLYPIETATTYFDNYTEYHFESIYGSTRYSNFNGTLALSTKTSSDDFSYTNSVYGRSYILSQNEYSTQCDYSNIDFIPWIDDRNYISYCETNIGEIFNNRFLVEISVINSYPIHDIINANEWNEWAEPNIWSSGVLTTMVDDIFYIFGISVNSQLFVINISSSYISENIKPSSVDYNIIDTFSGYDSAVLGEITHYDNILIIPVCCISSNIPDLKLFFYDTNSGLYLDYSLSEKYIFTESSIDSTWIDWSNQGISKGSITNSKYYFVFFNRVFNFNLNTEEFNEIVFLNDEMPLDYNDALISIVTNDTEDQFIGLVNSNPHIATYSDSYQYFDDSYNNTIGNIFRFKPATLAQDIVPCFNTKIKNKLINQKRLIQINDSYSYSITGDEIHENLAYTLLDTTYGNFTTQNLPITYASDITYGSFYRDNSIYILCTENDSIPGRNILTIYKYALNQNISWIDTDIEPIIVSNTFEEFEVDLSITAIVPSENSELFCGFSTLTNSAVVFSINENAEIVSLKICPEPMYNSEQATDTYFCFQGTDLYCFRYSTDNTDSLISFFVWDTITNICSDIQNITVPQSVFSVIDGVSFYGYINDTPSSNKGFCYQPRALPNGEVVLSYFYRNHFITFGDNPPQNANIEIYNLVFKNSEYIGMYNKGDKYGTTKYDYDVSITGAIKSDIDLINGSYCNYVQDRNYFYAQGNAIYRLNLDDYSITRMYKFYGMNNSRFDNILMDAFTSFSFNAEYSIFNALVATSEYYLAR